jgi:putative colanic acid biosynthesis glycosyltransferase
MRVLHLNTRLGEGGAAQVARDLHTRLLADGQHSHYFYGYGPKGNASPAEITIENARQISYQLPAIVNYGSSRLFGIDVIPPIGRRRQRLLQALKEATLVHVHNVHSHYFPFASLFPILSSSRKRVIWTAHDFWLITGRCASLEGCERWKLGCGSCPTGSNYPPAYFDLSGWAYRQKRLGIQLIQDRLTIVAPSKFVGAMFEDALPDVEIRVILNGLNAALESVISANPVTVDAPLFAGPKLQMLIVANDLSDKTKIDRDFINAATAVPNVSLQTVGKNSPFSGENIINHGTVTTAQAYVEILKKSDVLLFTSQKDTFGLVMAEALACGTPVAAIDSEAARELLSVISIAPARDFRELIGWISKPERLAQYYGRYTRATLQSVALKVFSGERAYREYFRIYQASPEVPRAEY